MATETVERRWDDSVTRQSPTGEWHESSLVPVEDRPLQADQTPLEAILPGEPKADKVVPSNDRGDAPDRAPPDRLQQEGWVAAIKQERTKRQAYQQRVSELEEQKRRLEEENQVLLTAPYSDPPGLEEVENLRAQARMSLSEVNFAKKFGADALSELHKAMNHVAQSGHPDFPLVWNHMLNCEDPAAIAAGFCNHLGLFDTDGAIQARAPRGLHSPPIERRRQQQQEFPSNLAGARNVGARRGPEWTGPTPLGDIFDRGRK
jgi:hypothetical protein